MRRRWKRRLLWAAVLLGVLLLAIPATLVQLNDALEAKLDGWLLWARSPWASR
jgi:hypothetical protein